MVLSVLVASIIGLFHAPPVQKAAAVVSGGKHDMSDWGGSNFQYDTSEICVFCHTPHSANTDQSYDTDPTVVGSNPLLNGEFLWNRAMPVRAWSPYTSSTLNSNTSSGPGKLSLLCLSCHDGVGAMNVLINNPGSGIGTAPAPLSMNQNQFGDFSLNGIFGALNIGEGVCDGGAGTNCTAGTGVNLQNDHPIGFVYEYTVDPGLKAPATFPTWLRRRMAITGNRVECSTCHDPHRTNEPGDDNMFLADDTNNNAQSGLCFACHDK